LAKKAGKNIVGLGIDGLLSLKLLDQARSGEKVIWYIQRAYTLG